MDENNCICCGRIIPEGRHICLLCERQNEMQTFGGRPKTNADKIRGMTDEELAELVSMKVCRILRPSGEESCPKGFYFGKCDECVVAWLKQEAKQ